MPARDVGAEWRVRVGAEETRAVFTPASQSPTGSLFICAHGAGGHMSDRGLLAATERLRGRGLDVVRFNFLYREQGSNRPDPMPRLTECIAAVATHARREVGARRLVLGGRSMGGRAASMLAADGFACDGLLLLAYPLHPAGQPEKLRAANLERIQVPVLCLNGTRDALCRRDLMERAIRPLAGRWSMHWLEGADHSYHVLKRSDRSDSDVLDEMADAFSAWESDLPQRRAGSA
ncbi:MAG TPA: alpha/beta family hydrolase [Burkholderiales bacterium]|nr:alpha/beta family hydrolase [Burkholderiales bacterium]